MKIRISLRDGSDRFFELSDVQAIEFMEPIAEVKEEVAPVEPVVEVPTEDIPVAIEEAPVEVTPTEEAPVAPIAEETPVEPVADPVVEVPTEEAPVEVTPVEKPTIEDDVEESINQLRANLRRMLSGKRIVPIQKTANNANPDEPTFREY